jgi:DNA primase
VEPKYLNSPESPIFLKKRTLYGLSEAREAMRRRDRVILVEGYFDHLALLRAGVEETVASMGTALTPEQAEKLRRLCPHAILCYDGDTAGRSATRVALGHLLAQGIRASVAFMPEGEDPDDVLGRQGTSALAARIEEAPDFLTWLLEDVRPNDPDLPAAERRERIRSVLQVLDAITDRILRYEEYRRVAREVSVPVEVLWQGSEKRSGAAPASLAGEPGPGTPGNPLVLSEGEIPAAERRILQALMGGGYKPLILGTLRDEYLTHPGVRRLVAAFRDAGSDSEAIDFQRHFKHFRDARDVSLLSRVALEEGPEPTEEGVVRDLRALERRHWERQKVAVDTALSRARNEGQPAEETELLRKAQEIGRRIAELKSSRKGRDVGH